MPNNLIHQIKSTLTLGQFEKEVALLHKRLDENVLHLEQQDKLLLELIAKCPVKTAAKPKTPTQEK